MKYINKFKYLITSNLKYKLNFYIILITNTAIL